MAIRGKVFSATVTALLLASTLIAAFNVQPVKSDYAWTETIYIQADGSIQPSTAPISSVDNVTYTLTDNIASNTEGIVIERNNMTLDGAGYTVQGSKISWSKGIYLNGLSNITIKKIKIKEFFVGIYLYDSLNSTVSESHTTTNEFGIWLDASSDCNSIIGSNVTANNVLGIELDESSHNSIVGNNLTNNRQAIGLYESSNCNKILENRLASNNFTAIFVDGGSSNNSIHGNCITANAWDGIDLEHLSNYNSVVGNNIADNNGNGIVLGSCSGNNIFGNNVTANNEGFFLTTSSNNAISGNNIIANVYDGFWICYSLNNTICGNNVENNMRGLHLYGSSDNSIVGNTITKSMEGIFLTLSSNYNIIKENNILDNQCGISLDRSSNNSIYHNNFVNNTSQAASVDSLPNAWDDGYPSGGNYWSDYMSVDVHSGPYQNETGSDGMGDTPYVIDADNQDNYPLMNPWPSGWKLDFAEPTNHPIVDFAVYNGSLYAAADSKLYVKDGSSWNVVDAPTFVTSLEPYGDKLVVGGKGGLYCYDGTPFNLIFSVPTYIRVLGAYNNTLYAGTFLDKPPILYYCNGNADNPDNWHIDTSFSAILNFSGPFGSVDSFAEYDGNLYVTSGGNIYSYNETGWNAVKTFDDVYGFSCMQAYNDKLYLATRDQGWRKPLYQGGTGFSGRIIEYDGENWTTVLDHDYWVYSLGVYDDKLYAGTANKILMYNGTSWETSFNATEGAYYAISMITYDGKVYVGMGNGYIFADPAPDKANPEIIVVPEFSSNMVLAVFMALTMLAAALTRKSRTKRFD